ncbi:ABC transporter ATP-binding protein [Pseudothauera nasutitermitis]|uniref:ABC transporter ATP-binding protein n=1 Tax=Pseudothauera nasutitermitis TaxID=2565930 RepID=A0A4S4B1T3_9RHOO|nr:ABC transporter ATP-binding protein [Pseudothauera nasutitermitis]THF66514.1 ABC transporter ATP-binding protein [Pseudothauera nasutitermitis]
MSSPSPTAGTTPRLRLAGIRKVYPTVVANDGIDLTVEPGEIHAVLGENGAGKSTLMKIIYGVTRPSAGEIHWEGERVEVANPARARALGIGMVFQHFSLFETLTVAENVALALPGRPPLAELTQRIAEVSEHYGLPVDPRRHVHALSVGERQRVEIIRCLLQNPRLLIMDEPTSVLTPQAVRRLFDTLRMLSVEGCSILYISHKLDEIQELCHTATVLRGGRVTGHCKPAEETPQSMARLMIGKDLPVCEHGPAATGGEARLQLSGLSHASDDPFGTDLRDIHLDVHAGEIVGIAGVSGNGQQELLRAISGEERIAEKFPVRIGGVEAGRLNAAQRRRLGLCFVPEERLGRGAVPSMSLADNAVLTAARNAGLVRGGFLSFARARRFAAECIERFDVRSGGPRAAAKSLSGGNLQKFIVGREVLQTPRLLVCAQPTWGVDVGAAAFIRQALIDLRNRGCAVLVISEELDELFEICDRIAVIAKGRLSPARPVAETSVEDIGVWMSGLWPGAEPLPAEVADAAA